MKSTMERIEKEEFQRESLQEFKGIKPFVVFVTDCRSVTNFSGFVVYSENNVRDLGYYSSTWVASEFKPFSGKITLEQ